MTFSILTTAAVVVAVLLLNLFVRRRLNAISKHAQAKEEGRVNRELANW